MKMLARAGLVLAATASLVASPAGAATTVTIYGVGGAANVTLPDTMAAALLVTGRAVVADPRDNDALAAIGATFSSTYVGFLRCLATQASCGATVVGALDFSDANQSAFIL